MCPPGDYSTNESSTFKQDSDEEQRRFVVVIVYDPNNLMTTISLLINNSTIFLKDTTPLEHSNTKSPSAPTLHACKSFVVEGTDQHLRE